MMQKKSWAPDCGSSGNVAALGCSTSISLSAAPIWCFSGALKFLFLVALLLPVMLPAQVQNGTIVGTVTDAKSAVVAGADVVLTNTATNLVLRGQTNAEGAYSFPQLLPGKYTVAVEKDGFQKTVSSLILTVGQYARVDVALTVGSNTETVEIEADDASTLDTQTSNLDYTVQSQQVDDLPLNGRNPYGLAVLSPGIMPGANFGVGVSVARGAVVAAATNNFQSNGGIGGSNEVLLDGVSIVVCCQGQPAVTPSTEVVSQFKVVTSNAPAEYGRTSGAVLNIATKTGTNQLRGVAYDFLRNDKLDAANFFTKRSGVYPYPGHNDFRQPHRANQYGVFVGGPVFLPHLYNGHDKTFFTFGYEGIRNLNPTTGITTVPTNLMRQGIFTEASQPVYDPSSLYYDANNNPQRNPVAAASCNGTSYAAGYCIPASQWNSVAKAYLALYPTANLSGTTNNYSYVENLTSSDDQYNFRIDHNFNDKHRSFMRGTKSKNDYTNYDLFNTKSGSAGWQQHLTAYLFAVGHLWSVTPSTLLQFSYGFARQTNYQVGNSMLQYNASDYGFSSNFASQQQIAGLPVVSISSEVTPMFSASFNQWAHFTHSLNASALIQKGKHNFALGYNGRLVLENQRGLTGPTGSFSFDGTYTGGPTPSSSLASGQSMFDGWGAFLLGSPSTGTLVRQKTVAFNQWVSGLYAQDDWRFNNRLTVNMGVRWDVESGFKERHNNWADFDPTMTNPISSGVGFNVVGGAQFLGANGNPQRTSQTVYHAFAPRLGFSYAVTPKTVARGGYGILYLPLSQRGYNDPNIGFTKTNSITSSANGYSPAVTLDNPFPSGVALPTGASAGAGVSVGSSISGFEYKNPLSYQQQWNFGLERSLSPGMSLTLNYVGGHGVDLPLNYRPNDLQPAYWGAEGDTSYATSLQKTTVTNPFYGVSGVASGLLTNAQVQKVQLLSAYPQYTAGAISSIQNSSVGVSYYDKGSVTYNALQVSMIVNHPGGMTGSISYVFSKGLGNVSDLTNGFLNSTGNPGVQNFYFLHSNEHSVLATDVPQRIAGTAAYPLPIGKGKKYLSHLPGWQNQLAGGWTVTTIIDAYSGFPAGLTVTGAPTFAGTRPVYTGSATHTSGSVHKRLGKTGVAGSGYFNPVGFRLPQSFELGTVPRSAAALRGPVSFDDNVSLIKSFPIRGEVRLEVRAEAFNVLNKVDFGMPNTTFGSSSFGFITSQYNLPRNIQMSMKVHF